VQLRTSQEVSFYRTMSSRRHFDAALLLRDIDGDGPDFMLLLEDLSPARRGDQLAL
jgi:hypothetical protein